MRIIKDIPTNLIFGFLGVGKTTAVLDWIRQKPADQSWSVLVNEFGEVGIDGAIYQSQGIAVKEIPGGCMCCAQGVPLQVAVNRLLRETLPDRLLIETSGIGHPSGVLNTLQGEGFRGVLDLKAIIALVDPEQLLNAACVTNDLFLQQLALADVLVANKVDLASAPALSAFQALSDRFTTPKAMVASATRGKMQLPWLDYDHSDRQDDFAAAASAAQSGRWQSMNWRFPATTTFDLDALQRWIQTLSVVRLKGIVNTKSGSYVLNYAAGTLAVQPAGQDLETRLQIIEQQGADRRAADLFASEIEKNLNACIDSDNKSN